MSVPYGGFISISFLRSSKLCLLPRLYLNYTYHKLRYVSQTNCSEQYCQPKFFGFMSSVNRFAKVRRKSGSFGNKTWEHLLRKHTVLYGQPLSAVSTVIGLWAEQSVQWLGCGLNKPRFAFGLLSVGKSFVASPDCSSRLWVHTTKQQKSLFLRRNSAKCTTWTISLYLLSRLRITGAHILMYMRLFRRIY
jgi:hypothetical protein